MNIINSPTASLEAGMVVTCQLGNMSDSYWYPAAPVLLVHTNVSFLGVQFTGLYKDSDDNWHVARFITSHTSRDNYARASKLEVGIAYCTSSLPFDQALQSCEFLSVDEDETFAQGLRFHAKKVADLPTAAKYVGLVPQV